MVQKTKGGYYAVRVGRETGIWTDWTTCEQQIKGYPGAVYQKFETRQKAEDYLQNGPSKLPQKVQPPAESSGLSKSGPYYAVRSGHEPGIYYDWPSAQKQIIGYPNAKHQKFTTLREAKAFLSAVPWLDPQENTEHTHSGRGKKRAAMSDLDEDAAYDIVYCDGACKGNGQPGSVAGIGVWWGHDDPRNIAERCPGGQTNNRAELIAILRVLETADITNKTLLVRTDSRYSINCFDKWLPKWVKNGFKTSDGKDVKNPGVIRCISVQIEKRAKCGQKIRFQHVPGHSGIEGNEEADRLANEGARLPELPDQDWASIEAALTKAIAELGVDHTGSMQMEISYGREMISRSPSPSSSPNKTRKVTPQPSTPRDHSEPIDLDAIPEPPQSPRRVRSKKLPSAAERYAEARRRALLIYPLLPEEMDEGDEELFEADYVEVTPRRSPPPPKASPAKGLGGMSTNARASLASRSRQPQPVASSSRIQHPSAPNGSGAKQGVDEIELGDYAAGLVDDDDILNDL